jgi:hypothetical protein
MPKADFLSSRRRQKNKNSKAERHAVDERINMECGGKRSATSLFAAVNGFRRLGGQWHPESGVALRLPPHSKSVRGQAGLPKIVEHSASSPRRLRISKLFGVSLLALPLFSASLLSAATLSDPEVDKYNVRIGTQTFAGLYQFTTNTLLVETAQAIQGLGSDTIKMYLGVNYPRQYNVTLPSNITNLISLARDYSPVHQVFDMPFRHIIAWAYPFANVDAPFGNGYSATEATNDYREMYDLTRYLLTNYNNSGKTFYLGHWEGDGYFTPWTTNPSPTAIQGMINWQNHRQKAVDDAKAATVATNVNVFYYAEANRVRDAMLNGPNNNQRVINYVIPYVTNLDYLSYSSYDAMNLAASDLYATLDYMESKLPTNKVSVIPGQRIWIGEYGWGGSQDSNQQEPTTRAYIQRLLNYTPKDLPYILFWEIYDNETNKDFWLIDSNGVKVANYYLHQRFINNSRLLTAQFKETNGRVPNDSEFVSLVSPMLDQPIPAPINFTVANVSGLSLSNSAAIVSGTLAQGIYGDDCATVRVYFGRQDGGTVRAAWESSQTIGINTNFNPRTFTAILTNLVSNTNYFFRFYATNASGEVWAPASAQFSTVVLDPQSFGSRMKLVFSGYDRGEALLNFPALVSLSTNLPGFSYRQFASAIGGDLRFTDAGGLSPIPFEIDEWNTNGTSTAWVRVPQLSSTNDFIWAYWGNPSATSLPASSTNGSVWSADHLVVYHLKESGFPFLDSSRQHSATSGVLPASTAGKIGRGCQFNGTSQFLDAGTVNLGNAFTLSAWVNVAPTAPANIQTIWANQKGGFASAGFAWFVNTFNNSDHKIDFASGDGTAGNESTTVAGTVPFGEWHLLSVAVDRTAGTAESYMDGTDLQSSSSIIKTFANNADLNLGRFTNANFYFTGVLDEARIQTGTVSSNWVWANWMTVASNATFESYSTVTQQSPALAASSTGTGLVLQWPGTGVGFALYTTTNLGPSAIWTLATNQAALVNGQWQVSVPDQSAASRFYRLKAQ